MSAVWDRVLTADEIQLVIKHGPLAVPRGLVAYDGWPLDRPPAVSPTEPRPE